jgi:hypothetical protein
VAGHNVIRLLSGVAVATLLASATAAAQSDDRRVIAVAELGAAAEQSLTGGGAAAGPTVAVEATPIENWLELEAGVTPLFSHSTTEWDVDLLLKKPWTLSRTVEFMFGAGPEWVHTISHGSTTSVVDGEAALDFMIWPSPSHRFGWYVEPSYALDFGHGHEQSLGVSAGLLIAIP